MSACLLQQIQALAIAQGECLASPRQIAWDNCSQLSHFL